MIMHSHTLDRSHSPSFTSSSDATQLGGLRLPFHRIEYPENQHFIARQSILHDITSKLLPGRGSRTKVEITPAFAIWGNPGQGKTQTALQFAYQNTINFKSILWVSADRSQKLLEGLSEYALSLGLLEKSTDLVRDANALLNWYQTTDTPWLLIYDNAEDSLLINKFWPRRSRNGAVLITSRDRVFATSTVANDGQELQPLSEDSAIEMLRVGIKPLPCDMSEARIAVRRMGCLPLGIQASIGLINEAQCPLSTYNEQFGSPRRLLEEAKVEHIYRNFAPYEKTLAEVWFEELHRIQESDADARRLIEIISLLDPDKVQEELFVKGSGKASINHETCFKNLTKCFMTLKRLVGTKNLEKGAKYRCFYVHRLLQVCTQRDMATETERVRQAFKSATILISTMMTSHWETSWPKIRHEYREYFPHVQAVHQFYREIDSNGGPPLREIPVSFLEMLRKAGSLCYKQNFFQLGFDILATAQEILDNPSLHKSIVGTEEAILFESVEVPYNQACIATEIGDFHMSVKHFQKAYDACEGMKSKGYNKSNAHFLVGGLANSYNGLNRNIEAEPLFLECLKNQPPEELFSPYEVNVARCMWAHGKYEEASKRLEDFIDRRAAKFGTDDTEDYLAGHAMYVLGNVRISQDLLDEAHKLHARALRCWELTYGPEHHKTGDANHKVAWHLAREKVWNDALIYLDKALAIYRSGSDQSFRKGEIARTTYKKSLVLFNLGRIKEAKKSVLVAEQLRRELLGTNHFPSSGEVSYNCLVSLWAR